MIKIDVISDVVCPWCYIGKKNLEKAVQLFIRKHGKQKVVINWRPYQLNPGLNTTGISRKYYLAKKFGSEANAKDIYKRIENAGAGAGINFQFEKIEIQPNSLNAHRLIQWAHTNNSEEDIVERLFDGFFLRGKNLGEIEVLGEIAASSGFDENDAISHLRSDDGRESVSGQDESFRTQGINGVPFFVINRKIGLSGAQPAEQIVDTIESTVNQTHHT